MSAPPDLMRTPAALRIAIIGPGAIGTVIAGLLHQIGTSATIAGRSPRPSLRLDTGREVIEVPGPVLVDPSHAPGEADVVFLAVKATQTAAAAPWLRALCGPTTVVCVLQNGVEQVDTVGAVVADAEVVPAIVWSPAERLTDGAVRLRGEPRFTVPPVPGAELVRTAMSGTACEFLIETDFATLAWRKLLQNAAAGIMAITGRRAGVYQREDLAELTLAYLEECLAVGRGVGVALPDDEPRRLLALFRSFPADMGTSILADREAGRPLEWQARNDVIRRLGRAHGIPTPISDVLVPLLAAISDGPG